MATKLSTNVNPMLQLMLLLAIASSSSGQTDININKDTSLDDIDSLVADLADKSVTTLNKLTINVNSNIVSTERLLANITKITGDVIINNCANLETLTMPNLKSIEGSIRITSNRKIVDFDTSNLTVVNGSIYMTESLLISSATFSIAFTSLKHVGESMYIRNIAFYSDFGDVELDQLKTVGGSLEMHAGTMTTISFPLLETVGNKFTIWRTGMLQHLDFPSLKSIGGNMLFQDLVRLLHLCDLGLDESGFTGSKIEMNGQSALVEVPQWIATKAGLGEKESCSGIRPTLIRNEEEYDNIAANSTLVNSKSIGPVIVTWLDITANQLAVILSKKTFIKMLTVEYSNITSLDSSLVSVEEIGSNLVLQNNPKLTSVTMPKLKKIGGGINFASVHAIQQLKWPALESIGADVVFNGLQGMVSMVTPKLKTINGTLHIRQNKKFGANALSTAMRSLTTVGSLRTMGLVDSGTLAFPSLKTVNGPISLLGDRNVAIKFPKLERVEGSLRVWRQGNVNEFSMPSLEYVGGNIIFEALPKLRSYCNFSLTQDGFNASTITFKQTFDGAKIPSWIGNKGEGLSTWAPCESKSPTSPGPSPAPTYLECVSTVSHQPGYLGLRGSDDKLVNCQAATALWSNLMRNDSPFGGSKGLGYLINCKHRGNHITIEFNGNSEGKGSPIATAALETAVGHGLDFSTTNSIMTLKNCDAMLPHLEAFLMSSLSPSMAPTLVPTKHTCNDDSHGCDKTKYGLCFPDVSGPGYTCGCAKTHRCEPNCKAKDHSCIRLTAPPTKSPSSQPTPQPTASPLATNAPTMSTLAPTFNPSTTSPTTSAPTAAPSLSPTSNPTTSPTSSPTPSPTSFPTLFPTPFPTPSPTTSPTIPPTQPKTTTASSNSNESDAVAAADTTTTVIVIAIVVVLIVILSAVVLIFIKKRKSQSDDGTARTFDNPLYDVSTTPKMESNPTYADSQPLPTTTGYMDVAPTETTGYMDVAPEDGLQSTGYMDVQSSGYVAPLDGFQSSDEEDV